MKSSTLEKVIDLACSEYENVQFIWHGGEPLLAGLHFYQEAIRLQNNYPHCHIRNTIQCNLTLLSEENAKFFIANHFRIGSSFDGIENELTRGNTCQILEKYKLYKSLGGQLGFIMVLSSYTVDSLISSYEIFKQMNANYSINNYISISGNKLDDKFYIPANIAISKMCELFDYWVNDSTCNIHLNTFEEYLAYILEGKTNKCRFNSCLGHWMCIRPDGQIMPCNRYFPERYSYGNINTLSKISDAFNSDGFVLILKEAIERKKTCKMCSLFNLCKGGCNNVAYAGGDICKQNDYYCVVLNGIFEHIKNWCDTSLAKGTKNPIISLRYKTARDYRN